MKKEEIMQKLKEEENKRDFSKSGRDGILEIGRKVYEYKGVKYEIAIAILQYYTLNPINLKRNIGWREEGLYAVVEYPEETKELVNAIEQLNPYREFLYHDTLHTHNDKQTIEEQVIECHDIAKCDIDSIPDIIKEYEQKIVKLKEVMNYG